MQLLRTFFSYFFSNGSSFVSDNPPAGDFDGFVSKKIFELPLDWALFLFSAKLHGWFSFPPMELGPPFFSRLYDRVDRLLRSFLAKLLLVAATPSRPRSFPFPFFQFPISEVHAVEVILSSLHQVFQPSLFFAAVGHFQS